jgi:nitronate monooxygenase
LFKTKFTELLGIEYPIQCGSMMHISNAEFVAANANAGIFSCLASAMFRTKEELTDELKKLKDLTEKPVGVNVSLLPGFLPMPVERYIEICHKQGIGIIETAGHSPEPYRPMLIAGGFLHIHKCARVRDAVKAETLGVDMISVVGAECGGHPSEEDVTSLILIPQVADRITVPLIAGGGFSDGRTLVVALALGADGVLMGTRFLSTSECRIHPLIKKKLLQAKATDTILIQRSIGSTRRVLKNDWAKKILEMESKGISLEQLLPYISGSRTEYAWIHGEEDAIFPCGQVVGRIKEILSIKDVIASIMSEAEESIQKVWSAHKKDSLVTK